MGGLFAIGIVLALLGLSIMFGLMTMLVSLAGIVLIIVGVVAAVAGGGLMLFGSALNRMLGAGLMVASIAVAFMGLIIKFAIDLWIIHWLIEFGGVVLLVIGIVLGALGMIGMLKGALQAEPPRR